MNNKTSLNNELKTLNTKYKTDKSNMELKNSIKDLKIKIKEIETKIDELKTKFLSTTKFKIDNSNDQFSNSLLMFSLKYYQLVDGFSYFALTNENEFVVLNIDQLDNKEAVTNSIKVLAGISFADNAGEQGGKISIKLK
jgi:hypothetical protein